MSVNKVFISAREAIFDVKDGSSIIFGGPGGIHNAPTSLIWALKVHRRTVDCEPRLLRDFDVEAANATGLLL